MPSSHIYQITSILEVILNTRPQSVLDVGVGFGKFGFLCREYLELWDGRNIYGDWQRRIDGIEIFEKYLTAAHHYIYDNIYVGDVLKILPALETHYDLILLIDVIEHCTKRDGLKLLEDCSKKANACLISTPKDTSAQQAAFGNPHETHRSQWTGSDFLSYLDRICIPNNRSWLYYIEFNGCRR